MKKRSILSVAVALLLIAGAAAPGAAHGADTDVSVSASAGAAPQAVSAPAPEAPPDDAPATRRSAGSKLARVLSAPFRALARFFGGGRKGVAEAAKKPARPAVVRAEAAAVNEAESGKKEVAPPPASSGAAAEVAAAKPAEEEGPRVVRPGAPAAAPPKLWVPVIAGVPPDSLSQGRALLQHGYLNEAISELSVAATVGPNLVEANNLLGLAYDRRGWHRAAAECYERALSAAPKDPVVLGNLGYSLYLDDNYPAALRRLKEAARLSPGTPVIHRNVGVVQARLGRYDDAFKSFARAGGEYDAHLQLARILETARRDKDAIRHYEAALRLQPDTTSVLERLAVLYDRTGRKGDAETARRALSQPRNQQKTATGGGG